MPSRDQPLSYRASAFCVLGAPRLLIEQLAGIPSQRQFEFQRGDALVGGGQLVGFDTRGALNDSGIDVCLTFSTEQGGLAEPGLGRHGTATVHLSVAAQLFAGAPTTSADGACELLLVTLPWTLTTVDLLHGYRSDGLVQREHASSQLLASSYRVPQSWL